jgi:outer membrane biosynthesis protein TonB
MRTLTARVRLTTALVVGGLVAVALAGPVSAAAEWTLTITPSTAQVGTKTAFKVRVENHIPIDHVDGDISCVKIELPDTLEFVSVTILGTNVAVPWSASSSNSGGSGTRVFLRAGNAIDHLHDGDWLEAEIVATAEEPGSDPWVGWAYPYTDCSSDLSQPSISVSLTVVAAATPTPKPSPSPTPTPIATPTPTPTPTPTLTASPTRTPTPTRPPDPTPTPTPNPTPAPSAVASAEPSRPPSPEPTRSPEPSPDPSPSPTPSESSQGPVAGGGPVEPGDGSPTGPDDGSDAVAALPPEPPVDASLAVGLDALVSLEGTYEWLVPFFVVSVPGFLVIAAIAVQSLVGLAWLLPSRRSLATDRRSHHRAIRHPAR